jgi:hypothetical protein
MEDTAMKKVLILAALAAAALAVSCQNKEIVDNPQDVQHDYITVTFELPAPEPATKIAIDETDGKVTWVPGDKIKIHGEKVAEMQTIELTDSDISADGRVATITFDKASMAPYGVHDYYALYPAEAAGQFLSSSSTYHYCEFTDTNKPLMAAYLNGTSFVFRNLCAVISFKITESFDSYVFSGNNDETVGYGQFAIKRTADDTYTKARNNPMSTITGSVVSDGVTPNLICIPEGADFTQGFAIRFKSGGTIVKEAKTTNPLTLERRRILPLGDITSKLVAYVPEAHHTAITGATDLGASETANCYVITAPGSYKIPVVKGNSNESAGVRAKTKLVWETYNNAEDVTRNSVIAAVDWDDDDNYVYFKTPASLLPGNALIAAVDADDNILWSWHIWIPSSSIEDLGDYKVSTKYYMDRNLGALVPTQASGAAAPESFGMLYQWGRKDPFVGARSLSSGSKAKVAGEERGVTDDTSFDLAASYAHPNTFAKNNAWRTGDLEWNPDGNKSIDDPCPAGYKVPEYNAADALWQKVTVDPNFDASLSEGWWKLSSFVFPMSGYCESGGDISHPGDRSKVWTSPQLDGTHPEYGLTQYLYDNSGAWASEPLWGNRKRYAASVRCQKIEGEVPEPEAQGATGVVIDGNMSDWADATAIAGGTERIVEWKFGSDSENLYFYYKITQSKIKYDSDTESATYGDYSWGSYIYVAIDADNNEETGDLPNLGGLTITGLEALALVYPWRGNFNDSSLTTVNGEDENGWIKCPLTEDSLGGATVYGAFDGTYAYVELSIPRSMVGSPAAGKIKVQHSMNWYLTPVKAITIN